jgi:integrase
MRDIREVPIRASDVVQLIEQGLRTHPLLALLDEAGLLTEDRPTTIEALFQKRICDLPVPMAEEMQLWFDVLHHGSTTPPRSRPRAPSTIKCRLTWSLPTLHAWASAGHDSLREISREDILIVLPTAETPRAQLGGALRSVFGTLKAHKVIFINPMSGIVVGNFTRSMPLPTDTERLRELLNSSDPPCAAMAALLIFHGLRPIELRDLRLTDVRDGRLHLADRTVPLADPVRSRLTSYLDERYRRWPTSINPHLFIHSWNAGSTEPTKRYWVNSRLGMAAWTIRQDRLVDEARATGGDLRRMADFFGVTIDTAAHYASLLNHPALEMEASDFGS